ncbi:Prefoldin subunit beta [Candidatus Anstonella stagnisolia]|nr:Prefoldin subunit beta [Candidatus Anstonella stagnisolia]
MAANVPKNTDDLEKQLQDFQNLQRQLQLLSMQKQQVAVQLDEVKMAEEEMAKSKGALFRAVGSLIMESSKEDVKAFLKERKETLDMRAGITAKQEDKLRKQLTEMRTQLEAAAKMAAPQQ